MTVAAALCAHAAGPDSPASAALNAPSPSVPSGASQSYAIADTADTVFVFPEFTVTAPGVRSYEALLNRSGFVATVNLDERRDRVEDLSAVLSQVVGVRVKQYGGLGGFATASIRGSSSSQVQVYLDGIPLNDAYMGMTDLSDLPLGGIQRIEVFRGFVPPHLGSSAIGGAVNLVTNDEEKWVGDGALSRLEVRESYGAYGTSRHEASAWCRLSGLRLFFHGGYMATDGDFTFTDTQSTPENPDDDEEAVRVNNDFETWNLLGRLQGRVPHVGEMSLSHYTVLREQGVPGLGFHQSENARYDRDRHVTHLKLRPGPVLLGSIHGSVSGFYSRTRERFNDPDGKIALTKQATDNLITAYGGAARAKLYAPLVPASLEILAEGRSDRYNPAKTFPVESSGPERKRHEHTVSLSGELDLIGGSLVLSAAQRLQGYTSEFYDETIFPWIPPSPQGKIRKSESTPQFGFRWQPMSFATLKGNWGEYYRLPTFLELFGNLGSVTGAAGLEPETGLNRDIGLIIGLDSIPVLGSLFLEAVYLDNEVDDLILFFPNSQHTVKPVNIGSATIKGWEASLSASPAGRLRISGNYAKMDTEDTSDIPYYNGNDLAARPENEIALFLDWIEDDWKAAYELHYIGANFLDRANLQRTPARSIHNALVRMNMPIDGLSLSFEGRNLADNRISDVSGFPLPGRSFYATLQYRL
jgi:iron complex outermembrane receptor protein